MVSNRNAALYVANKQCKLQVTSDFTISEFLHQQGTRMDTRQLFESLDLVGIEPY